MSPNIVKGAALAALLALALIPNGGCGVLNCEDFGILQENLRDATVGTPYEAQLSATSPCNWFEEGVDGQFVQWSVTEGALPPGITLDTDGLLSGTPAEAGSYLFTIRAKHKLRKNAAEREFTLTVNAAG